MSLRPPSKTKPVGSRTAGLTTISELMTSVGARMSTVGGSKGTLNCVSGWIEKRPRPGVLPGWDWRPGWTIGRRFPIDGLRMGCRPSDSDCAGSEKRWR